MKFTVRVTKEWIETGEATVEASSIEEARRLANDLLDDDEAFEWDEAMDPGELRVASVTPT